MGLCLFLKKKIHKSLVFSCSQCTLCILCLICRPTQATLAAVLSTFTAMTPWNWFCLTQRKMLFMQRPMMWSAWILSWSTRAVLVTSPYRKFTGILFFNNFVELGWSIGDGDERYHDEIGVGFGLTWEWVSHDSLDFVDDCTANSISCPSFDLCCFVRREAPLFSMAWLRLRCFLFRDVGIDICEGSVYECFPFLSLYIPGVGHLINLPAQNIDL